MSKKKNEILKPSIKSTEGQSVIAVVIGGLALLYELITGTDGSSIPIEQIIAHAEAAKEIAEAYKLEASALNISGAWSTAKVTAVLAFIYKIYGRFTDSRTELKKTEMQLNIDQEEG